MSKIDSGSEDIAKTKDEIDVERHFLGTTVTLSDGTEGLVFSRGSKNVAGYFLYNCHLCSAANLPGERSLQTHIAGKKHQSKLSQTSIDAATFRAPLQQKSKIQMNIAPGEPVPPGFENEVKPMPQIQGVLNKYKEHALIGIEYCLELTTRDIKEPSYICLICDKRGDPRTIVSHWTSYNHRLKFLEKHFPSVIKELVPYRYNPEARNVMPRLIQTIAEAIEEYHGRLSPTVIDNNEFKRNRNRIIQDINSDKHFDEKNGPSFLNVIDKKSIDNLIKGSKSIPINIDTTKKRVASPSDMKLTKRIKSDSRKDRNSLDSISSDSDDTSLTRSPLRSNKIKRKKSQSPAYRIISRVKRSPPFEEEPKPERKVTLPTPRELSIQASEISHERYRWEKYRCLVELAVKDLEKSLKEYEKSPEKHPLYPEEWKKFWNRRYKELQAEKKDPNKYDFKPEWIVFWTKRMKELHDEDVEKKKIEIKKKLGLSDDAEEKTDQLKQQYKVKTSSTTTSKTEKPLAVIDISDDEESIMSHRSRQTHTSTKRHQSRSRSSSLSSLSDEYGRKSHDKYQDRSRRTRSRDKESDRHRDRERDIYYSKEREIIPIPGRERYPPGPPVIDYYRQPHPRPTYYPPPPHPSHYSYRTMDRYEIPQYEPSSAPPAEEKDTDDGPLTVVAVLRLLTALEDHLGSLGPKVVDMLAKALALEKVKANSSDEMLLNEDYSVFFETVKEKLKGQLIADVLDPHKIKAVKKAIKNIAAIIHQVNNKPIEKDNKDDNKETSNSSGGSGNDTNKKSKTLKDLPFDRQLVASKLAAALVLQERTDISTEDMDKLIHVFVLMVKESKDRGNTVEIKDFLIELGIIEQSEIDEIGNIGDYDEIEMNDSSSQQLQSSANKEFSFDIFDPHDNEEDDNDDVQVHSSSTLESLTDSDLQTLLQNFKHLSSDEQHHLIAHLKKLESTDPVRVEKLRKFVDLSDLKDENNKNKSSSSSSLKIDANNSKDNNEGDNVDNKNTKVISMYSDDDDDDANKAKKMIDSDNDDDDDYNFDEIVKAAKSTVRESKQNDESSLQQRPHSLSREPEADLSNLSKASSSGSAAPPSVNLNPSLANTHNLIANLMGSLQKNNQAFNQSSSLTSASSVNNENTISTVVTTSSNQMNPNFTTMNTNFQNNMNNSFNNQQGNFNPNNSFTQSHHQQQQQQQQQRSQMPPSLAGNNNPLGALGNLSNLNNLQLDFKQLQSSQVQQMITTFLAQQQQQQRPQQHNFQNRNPMGGSNQQQGPYF